MDPLPLTDENTERLLAIVAALQPATTAQVREELQRRHGLEVETAELRRYLEWLRSGFPLRLVHVGLERWSVVEIG